MSTTSSCRQVVGHADKLWIVGFAMVLVLFNNKKLSNVKEI